MPDSSQRFLDYAPAPESTSILRLRDTYGLFIDGDFVAGSGKSFATISPATEKKLAISSADAKDVDRAVAAAQSLRPYLVHDERRRPR